MPADLRGVVKIAAGDIHSLALLADGTLRAWGANTYNQVTIPPEAINVVDIAANALHNVALRADGTVIGFGRNNFGQCNVPPGLSNVVSISAGQDYSVALLANGTAVLWGDNSDGALNPPANVTDIVAIAAGQLHCLALRSDGTLIGWGSGGSGELQMPPDFSNVRAFATFESHSLAILGNACTPLFAQPQPRTVLAGTGVLLTTASAGPPPVSCQWRFNGLDVPGGTNVQLSIPDARLNHDGFYSFVLSNACGAVTSSLARLMVNTPGNLPFYATDFESSVGAEWSSTYTETTPYGQRRFLGRFTRQTVSLSLTNLPPHTNISVSCDLFVIQSWDGNTGGSYGPDYWSFNVRGGSELMRSTFANSVNASYRQAFPDGYPGGSFPAATGAFETNTLGYSWDSAPADSVYRLTYSFSHTNSSVILDFVGAPNQNINDESWGLDNVAVTLSSESPAPWSQIVSQPQSQAVSFGSGAVFSVGVSGPGPFTYQWKHNGSNLVDSDHILGAQSGKLMIVNVLPGDYGDYTVEVKSDAGSAVSVPVSLSYRPPQFAWVQQAGGTGADDAQNIALDSVGNVLVAGAFPGTATFATNTLISRGNDDIYVAKLEAWESLPVIVAQPQPQAVLVGSNVAFQVVASGAPPLSYQWLRDGTNLPGATNMALTLTNVRTNDAGGYQVTVANDYGSVSSAIATLRVLQLPRIVTQPRSRAVAQGGAASFQVSAASPSPRRYQWQFNDSLLPGETNAVLSLTNVHPAQAGTYTVQVSNDDGAVLSDPAQLTMADSPGITSWNLNISTLSLTFSTEFGPTYQVVFTHSLSDPAWTVLATLAGTGLPLTVTDNNLSGGTRFYRILVK